ncbi:hypothetical protein WAF17_22605 (plasmid) [Bernardetia sp. ABR2-2B]|uniref:hypothetical protein n=1 Tax=Bernardetia sp. ABR2-2B TaxID=3127472 RepID=UPI0030CBB8C2
MKRNNRNFTAAYNDKMSYYFAFALFLSAGDVPLQIVPTLIFRLSISIVLITPKPNSQKT